MATNIYSEEKMIPARSKTSKVRGVLGGKILQKNGPSYMQSSAFFSVLLSFLHIP